MITGNLLATAIAFAFIGGILYEAHREPGRDRNIILFSDVSAAAIALAFMFLYINAVPGILLSSPGLPSPAVSLLWVFTFPFISFRFVFTKLGWNIFKVVATVLGFVATIVTLANFV